MTEPTSSPNPAEEPTPTPSGSTSPSTDKPEATDAPTGTQSTAGSPQESEPTGTESTSESATDEEQPAGDQSSGDTAADSPPPAPSNGAPPPPPPMPRPPTGEAAEPQQAKLIYRPSDNGLPGVSVTIGLDFNPETIKISRNVQYTDEAPVKPEEGKNQSNQVSAMQSREEQLKRQGATVISMSVTINGSEVKKNADQLINWMEPIHSPPGKPGGKSPRVVNFEWGSLRYRCVMENVSLTFLRFSTDGTPIRAKVDLSLREQPIKQTATNPTSGGLVGRRSHVVVAGENLQRVAYATYGDPGAWRAIATLNGIDDPLRVLPGAELFLPNGDELAGGVR
jgi:nucleoid-associated protein YgaU